MRFIVITILFFLLSGCVSSMTDSNADHITQTHMALAESQEKSLNYQDAIKEYLIIFNKTNNRKFQKKAALKVARLNVHPNNSKTDYNAALNWLQIYSNLRLTPEEEENALILAVLIRQINLIEGDKVKLVSQIKKEKAAHQKKLIAEEAEKATLLKELTSYEAEKDTLEKEISILKEKLQKIKDIDVQMHKNP